METSLGGAIGGLIDRTGFSLVSTGCLFQVSGCKFIGKTWVRAPYSSSECCVEFVLSGTPHTGFSEIKSCFQPRDTHSI